MAFSLRNHLLSLPQKLRATQQHGKSVFLSYSHSHSHHPPPHTHACTHSPHQREVTDELECAQSGFNVHAPSLVKHVHSGLSHFSTKILWLRLAYFPHTTSYGPLQQANEAPVGRRAALRVQSRAASERKGEGPTYTPECLRKRQKPST